jgi:hypothetical protein
LATALAVALALTMLTSVAFADDGVAGAGSAGGAGGAAQGIEPQDAGEFAVQAAPAFDPDAASGATPLEVTKYRTASGTISKTGERWYSFTALTAGIALLTTEPGELFALYDASGTVVAVSTVVPDFDIGSLSYGTEYRYPTTPTGIYYLAIAAYPEYAYDHDASFMLYANLAGDADFIAAKEAAQTIPLRTETSLAANSGVWYTFRAANGEIALAGAPASSSLIYDAEGYRINPYGAGPAGIFYPTYPGATYYLYANNTQGEPRDLTVTPYRQPNTNDDFGDWNADAALELSAEGVTQSFANESNTTWDVWHFSSTSTNEVEESAYDPYAWWWSEVEFALLASYQGYFSNYTVTTSWGGEILDTINDAEPSAHVQDLPRAEGEQLSWFHQYSTFPSFDTSVTGSVVFSYGIDIYVPVGKGLVLDAAHGGVFRDVDEYVALPSFVGKAVTLSSALPQGRNIDIPGRSTKPGEQAIIWSDTVGANQRFYVGLAGVDNEGEYLYYFENVNSGLVLDISGANISKGAAIIQWPYKETDNQKWYIEENAGDSGTYTITSALNPAYSLDVFGGQNTNGAKLILWEKAAGKQNQSWTIDELAPSLPSGAYSIRTAGTGNRSLDVSGNSQEDGAQILLWDFHQGENQYFWLEWIPETGYYLILGIGAQKSLDVYGGSTAPGAQIIQWEPHGGLNQQWSITDSGAGNESFAIIGAQNNLSLDVYGGNVANNGRIIAWPYHGRYNQQWLFDELLFQG